MISRPFLTSLALLATAAHAADRNRWSSYQADELHRGYVPGRVAVSARPAELWGRQVHGGRVNGIAVGDHHVFTTQYIEFGGSTARMVALERATGLPKWSVDPGPIFSLNPPALDPEGNVYFVSSNHEYNTWIHSYEPSGLFRWRAGMGAQWDHYFAPTIAYGEVALNGGTYGGMYRYKLNGDPIAFLSLGQIDEWTPVAWNNQWFVMAGYPTVIDRTTHNIAYELFVPSLDLIGAVGQTPVVVDNVGYLTNSGRLIGVHMTQGTILLDMPIQAGGQVTTDGNRLFVASMGGISERTLLGEPLRHYSEATTFLPPVIATDSHVIAKSMSGTTTFFDRASGLAVAHLDTAGEMALAGDVLYVGTAAGTMHAYSVPLILFGDGFD